MLSFNFNKSSRHNYRVGPTSIYKGKMKNVLDVFLMGEKVNGKLIKTLRALMVVGK